ncbi:MarR family winged helix-turn-helix transcriptional regulator [Amorphus coralli]|uniref:MarR family winged helix-turn-helix transcriptional regulator n=1 Tax=Amorphus coralli TaxID=340680 RepID=UPI00035C52EB|nr:MarR family winged helix-turn-helix transcriptional regulator [Amorphus coralli]
MAPRDRPRRSADAAAARKPRRRTADNRAACEQVDEIFRQWQTERPDIDPTPVRIYGLIGQIHLQATGFIDDVLAPYGLVRGTYDVLTALRRVGAPYCLTPKELSGHLLLSGAGLTSRLNKLEDLHLIARLPEPSDRRTVRIQLTAAGEDVINKVIPVVFAAQASRLEPLGEEGRQRLLEQLTEFADAIALLGAGAQPARNGAGPD